MIKDLKVLFESVVNDPEGSHLPWRIEESGSFHGTVYDIMSANGHWMTGDRVWPADAALIVTAINALPALLQLVKDVELISLGIHERTKQGLSNKCDWEIAAEALKKLEVE